MTKYAATYWPVDDHLYTAEKGQGAFLNGEKIFVSNPSGLKNTAGHCSSPRPANGPRIKNAWIKLFENETRHRNYACMFNLILVSRGVHDYYVSNGGNDYDHLAPVLICEEAGAVVTNSFGEPWKRGMEDMVIAGPLLHPKILELF